jgi:hypothetical protein
MRAHYNLEELWTVKPQRKLKRATATVRAGTSTKT